MIKIFQNRMPATQIAERLHFFYTFYRELTETGANRKKRTSHSTDITALQRELARIIEYRKARGIELLISGSGVRVPGGVPELEDRLENPNDPLSF